ncbi:MAG: hypothetical protein GY854_15260 [Deltaproteobacteria bacterium]|nr:hypothetical protein [Deltaproteobacteria bacterium]
MTEFDTDNQPEIDDNIDEELLALSGPPPSLRYAIFILFFLALSVFMAIWFFPELKYFSRVVQGTTYLGEAADVDLAKLKSDSQVSIDGIPLMSKSLEFKEGIRWFSLSDNMCHFFPLTGQSNLFVQWRETDEYKAFRDPATNPVKPGPPSHFEGHLVKREYMGPGFDRVWVYFDCLKTHVLRRCNQCLGTSSMDECRDTFTCAESNTKEQCAQILKDSEKPLDTRIAELEKKATGDELYRLSALREHRMAIAFVRLEEMEEITKDVLRDSAKLDQKDTTSLKELQREILALQLVELKVRATEPLKKIDTLGKEARQKLEASFVELEKLRKEKTSLTDSLKTLRAFADTGEVLEKLKKRATEIQTTLMTTESGKFDKLAEWKLDPSTENGGTVFEAINRLQALMLEVDKSQKNVGDAGTHDIAVAGEADASRPEITPLHIDKIEDPERRRVVKTLESLKNRATTLQSKIAALAPGQKKEFDRWLRKPDVLGSVPEGLRRENVLRSLGKTEQMLADMGTPSDEEQTLSQRLSDGIDRLDEIKKRTRELEARPGMKELEFIRPLGALEKEIASGSMDAKKIKRELRSLLQMMLDKGFYMAQLRGAPDELALLEQKLGTETIAQLTERLEKIISVIDNDDWILIDGEIPLDNLWVVLVYLLLIVMIVVNIQKLRRFWIAWKD